ncbi:MAG: phytanoyl-CoA dioxygenase family protein [Planctomycetota bacterium]
MTDSARPTPLSEDQIEQYYREGYILLPQLATPERVQAVLEEAQKYPVEAGGRWTPRIFDHDDPTKDAAMHTLLTDPQIVGAVEQVFEATARVYYGMLAVVPAQGGSGLQWHQDNQYQLILGRALNMFVAVSDITPDMANLWVAPQSHRQGLVASDTDEFGHRVTPEPDNPLPLPALKQGDVCLFDRFTLHRSKTNTTDRHRYAYAAQYMEFNARTGNTGQKDPKRMTADELAAAWESTAVSA